jgi:hypothetical protein
MGASKFSMKILSAFNIMFEESALTYAYPGTLSKRKVYIVMPLRFLLFGESFGVESLRIRIILWIMMEAKHGDYSSDSLFHNNIRVRYLVTLGTFSV